MSVAGNIGIGEHTSVQERIKSNHLS